MTTQSLKPGEQPDPNDVMCNNICNVQYSASAITCSFCSSSPRGPSTSPSAHSISTPEKNRFPRGTTSRSTFHGAQLRDRRSATYNGPPASPTLSHDTGALAQQRRGTSTGIISKITSKFVRRSVNLTDDWITETSSMVLLHKLSVHKHGWHILTFLHWKNEAKILWIWVLPSYPAVLLEQEQHNQDWVVYYLY